MSCTYVSQERVASGKRKNGMSTYTPMFLVRKEDERGLDIAATETCTKGGK